jgi:hypothetical protein
MPASYYGGMSWPPAQFRNPGSPWLTYNGKRVRFCFAEFRGDLDQYSSSLGMPYTNQAHFCMCCPQIKADKYSLNLSPTFNHNSYMSEIDKCRIVVRVDRPTALRLWAVFRMDNNKYFARVLARNCTVFDIQSQTEIALKRNDRLEVDGDVYDVMCSVADFRAFPITLVFWRVCPDHNFHGLSWFLRIPGSRYEHLMLDTLHVLDLGPTSRIIGWILSTALECGEWGTSNTEDGKKEGCGYLTRDLKDWYAGQPKKR